MPVLNRASHASCCMEPFRSKAMSSAFCMCLTHAPAAAIAIGAALCLRPGIKTISLVSTPLSEHCRAWIQEGCPGRGLDLT